jgi:hypothetical protein
MHTSDALGVESTQGICLPFDLAKSFLDTVKREGAGCVGREGEEGSSTMLFKMWRTKVSVDSQTNTGSQLQGSVVLISRAMGFG